MLMLKVFLMQAVLILAPNPGLYQRNKRHRGSRYSPLKRQETSLSIYPRCRSDPTVLDIIVVDKSGKPAGRSKLWISSSTGMKEALTDVNGEAKVEVTGCQIGIIIWTKDKQSKYKPVTLESCSDKIKKVVIQIDSACNFIVTAILDSLLGHQYESVSYFVITGGSTTTGSFVGGSLHRDENFGSACITVRDGDSLYMVISVQGSDFPNVLFINKVKEDTRALVTIPYPSEFLLRYMGHDDDDLILVAISNVWLYDRDTGNPYLESLRSFKLLPSENITNREAKFTTGLLYGVLTKNMVYIVAIVFFPDPGPPSQLQGNAVLYDMEGNVKVVAHPDQLYTRGNHWILGCFRGCLNTFKEKSKIVEKLPDTEDEIKEYCDMY